MRPLRLTMTAFGPYAGTEVVDFDALTELGLFVVAGNNGSGKTTIFDALHYSLFGTLPGRRASYVRLKSDHAAATAECSVALDFAAHGKQWRVERSPKQTRPKRRGTGSTEVERRATLYRLDHGQQGQATAIANKIGEVDEQCRQLVGLTGKQFERVALLPQGEFSRVLRESSTDRRELLRTLFSSEIFGDATSLLTEQAAQATAADRSVLDRLDHQQGVLATSLSELVGHSVSSSAADMQAAIGDFQRVQLADHAARTAELETTAAQTAHAHQTAIDIRQRMQRRSQVQQQQQTHQRSIDQHTADLARLDLARAAVPVASHVRAAAQQQQRHTDAEQQVGELHQRLNRALAAAGTETLTTDSAAPSANRPAPGAPQLDAPALNQCLTLASERLAQLITRLTERSVAAQAVADLQTVTNRLQGDLRRVANEISTLDQQMSVAQSQHRQVSADLAELNAAPDIDQCEHDMRIAASRLLQRSELESLESEHDAIVRRASDLDATIAQLQTAHEQADQGRSALPTLQQKSDSAVAALQSCTRRGDAAVAYTTAAARLTDARHAHNNARDHADRLFDAFIAGTAARVAQTLIDDEPCPVCGSAEHPAPAEPPTGDQVVTQAQVSAARVTVETLQSDVRRIETSIEHLRSADPDIASLSPSETAAEIATAKAMALGARTRADEARRVAATLDEAADRLVQARTSRTETDAELRVLAQRSNQIRGALGDLANTTVADLEVRAEQATNARSNAEQRAANGIKLVATAAQAAQAIDTIGLGQIAAKSRQSAHGAQLEERQVALDHAQAAVNQLEVDLAPAISSSPLQSPSATQTYSYEQRTQAARHASELLAELTTATARHHEAADGTRRARSILDARIAQSPFASAEAATGAFLEPHIVDQLEAQTSAYAATSERLQGQLQELADLPDVEPDVSALQSHAVETAHLFTESNRELITRTGAVDRFSTELATIATERSSRDTADVATRRLERVAALVKGDNDRNTSLENWVLAAHLRDVVDLANLRLARSTHQRFQLCVLDDGENKRGKWGLDLGVEDTVTGTRRPTAGLSGGELFQASLALALGLADAVMNQTAGVRIDALFIDEGFGSLDEVSVERAIDLLDELRDRGAMVGVITHVPALLDALPLGVSVIDSPDGQGSTIRQSRLAA